MRPEHSASARQRVREIRVRSQQIVPADRLAPTPYLRVTSMTPRGWPIPKRAAAGPDSQ